MNPLEVTPLFAGAAPGALGNEPTDIPTLTHFRLAGANNPCIVIFPGGGYGALATDHEGHQFAEFFNKLGISALMLQYRLGPRYRHPCMLQDAQRAVRQARANADAWGLDPARIGVIGFSAGGHLASTLATHFDLGDTAATDPIEYASCRPDLVVLGYPVITMKTAKAESGSRRNLLGPDPDPALIDLLSNEAHVTPETPPTFIFHTADDPIVPVENAYYFALGLAAAKVPHALHVFPHGPHGVGLARGDRYQPVLDEWPDRLELWLREMRFLL